MRASAQCPLAPKRVAVAGPFLRLRAVVSSGLAPEILNHLLDCVVLQLDKATRIELREASSGSFLQKLKFRRISLLDQPQPLPQNFACVLIPARGDKIANNLFMVFRKERRFASAFGASPSGFGLPQPSWHIMPMQRRSSQAQPYPSPATATRAAAPRR